MKEKKDDIIIKELMDHLGVGSVNRFAKLLGYKTGSGLYHILDETSDRSINDSFIERVLSVYPQINERFLRKKSNIILAKNDKESGVYKNPVSSKDYTLNDLPGLMNELYLEQKETNRLLKLILAKN